MRIEELISESQLNEGPGWDQVKAGAKQIGQGVATGAPGVVGGLAKGVGAIGGGVAGAWDKMKQGFNAGRNAVGGDATAGQQTGTAPNDNVQQDPKQLRKQGQAMIAQADQIEKQLKTSAPKAAPAQQTPAQQVEPTLDQEAPAQQAPAEQPTPTQQAPAEQPATAPAQQAPEPAAPQAAPAPQANISKPSPDAIKQAQVKKDLQRKQQQRKAGNQQPSGFAQSEVGQARNKIYAKADGSPGSYTVRESVKFQSKFLKMEI